MNQQELMNLRAVLAAVERGDSAVLGAEVFKLRGVVAQLVGMIEGCVDRYPPLEPAARKARALTQERPDVRARVARHSRRFKLSP